MTSGRGDGKRGCLMPYSPMLLDPAKRAAWLDRVARSALARERDRLSKMRPYARKRRLVWLRRIMGGLPNA